MANLLRFLYLQRVTGFTVPAEPQFDTDSTTAFLELLGRARLYLEFGAGGSTLAAARQGVETLSIESDPWYAAAVRRQLPANGRGRVLAAPVGLTREWGYPVFKRPSPRRLRRWKRYIQLPFEELGRGAFPDLILVDGRFRRACALQSALQAQRAGRSADLFFDDYAGRAHYHEVERYLGRPRLAGRAAVFSLGGAAPEIPPAAIEAAIRDCR